MEKSNYKSHFSNDCTDNRGAYDKYMCAILTGLSTRNFTTSELIKDIPNLDEIVHTLVDQRLKRFNS